MRHYADVGGEAGVAHDDEAAMDQRLLHRMVFFTDAVFAIVLTLLVLELRPPEGVSEAGRGEAMREMAGHLRSFAISFGLVSVFWVAHLATMRRLVRFDWPTAVFNLVFLFPVCLTPFVSAWLGGGFGDPFIWAMYCWALVAISAANVALVLVATRGGGRLMGGVAWRERAFRVARAASPGVAFGAGLALGAAGQHVASQFCWLLIPLEFLVAARFLKPKAPKAEPA